MGAFLVVELEHGSKLGLFPVPSKHLRIKSIDPLFTALNLGPDIALEFEVISDVFPSLRGIEMIAFFEDVDLLNRETSTSSFQYFFELLSINKIL